jgi:hypothetical protein
MKKILLILSFSVMIMSCDQSTHNYNCKCDKNCCDIEKDSINTDLMLESEFEDDTIGVNN